MRRNIESATLIRVIQGVDQLIGGKVNGSQGGLGVRARDLLNEAHRTSPGYVIDTPSFEGEPSRMSNRNDGEASFPPTQACWIDR